MKSQRPGILTFFCILGFLICFFTLAKVYSPDVQANGKLFAVYLSFSMATTAVCLAGFWVMHRWAFWAYAAFFVVNQAVHLTFLNWMPATLFPLVILAAAAFYYRRMT